MSDDSATAISWGVYDHLRIYLQDETLPQRLPESELRSRCLSAIAANGAQESVPLRALLDSITTPYLADQDKYRQREEGKYRQREEGKIPFLSGSLA